MSTGIQIALLPAARLLPDLEGDKPATDIRVTGTFDDWSKSIKLEKHGDTWEKEVNLPSADEKYFYKLTRIPFDRQFVIDGNEWVTCPDAPTEIDHHNNPNNVLTPDHIKRNAPESTLHPTAIAAIMSGVTPGPTTTALANQVPREPGARDSVPSTFSSAAPGSSTTELANKVPLESNNRESEPVTFSSAAPGSSTAELANKVPFEKKETTQASSALPGAFPETPSSEPAGFSVKPIPASAGIGNPIKLAAGQDVPDPSTLTSATLTSPVHDDISLIQKEVDNKTFGVSPLPATFGAGNPIQLKPGEPIPQNLTTNTINSTVTLDKESYENSGNSLLPGMTGEDASLFSLPPVTKNMIPESSLPLGNGDAKVGPFLQSAGPASTTAALANLVPFEPKVPDVVKESQAAAHVDPEASGSAEAVREKSEVEAELKKEVPEEPATSTSGLSAGGIVGIATGGVAAIGGAVAAGAFLAKDKALELAQGSSLVPESVKQTITHYGATADKATDSPHVPDIVKDSIAKAHQSPEATTNPEAVAEKSEVEAELKKEVPEEPATSTSGLSAGGIVGIATGSVAAIGGAVAAGAFLAKDKAVGLAQGSSYVPESVKQSLTQLGATTDKAADDPHVPDIVKESIAKSHESPEAAANPEAVAEKSAVESQLLNEVKPAQGSGLPAAPIAGGVAAIGGAVAAIGGAAAAGAFTAKDKAAGLAQDSSYVPESVKQSINQLNTSADKSVDSPHVPGVVKESIAEARQSPEAAANPLAVAEKSTSETELLKQVKPDQSTGLSAPHPTGTATAQVPVAEVPDVVKESIAEAHQSPEAAASHEAVAEKSAVEAQLLTEVKPEQGMGESAPTATVTATHPPESVSAVSDATTLAPVAAAPAKVAENASTTPRKVMEPSSSSESPNTTEKKKKRHSIFFNKIKSVFSDKK
ncbi:MAG: hypothetical protein M1829_002298 [Trizodia sp. TS-e1964]|nr:MAG: hypothetical protein M1829_002298 [Trizodia sp. TS-e1964]